MKRSRIISFLLVVAWLWQACGGGGSSGSSFSSLSYPDAVSLNTTKGLAATTAAAKMATTRNALFALNIDAVTNADPLQAAVDGYADASSDYDTLMQDIIALNNISFKEAGGSGLLKGVMKFDYVDPSGVDTLNSVVTALAAKQKECDDLFKQVPKLPSNPAEFALLSKAQQCAREFEALSAQQTMDTAVSDLGGLVGGAGGAAVWVGLAGGTLVSGGGLLAMTIGGVIGSRAVSAIWNACKSGGSKLVLPLEAATSGGSCSFSHADGKTGGSLLLQAVGTGTLEIFVDGCAPIALSGITISDGQSLSVNATCKALDSTITPTDVGDGSKQATSSVGQPASTTCANIVGLSSVASPADPAPGQTVTVSVSLLPPASGCAVPYSMVGTDKPTPYSQSGTLTTDSSGKASFTIPGGASGVVDTVITTESAAGFSRTITYTF